MKRAGTQRLAGRQNDVEAMAIQMCPDDTSMAHVFDGPDLSRQPAVGHHADMFGTNANLGPAGNQAPLQPTNRYPLRRPGR